MYVVISYLWAFTTDKDGRLKRQSRVIYTNIYISSKCNSTYTSDMKKYALCYMMLLFAAHTDNIAGILRGLRDVNNTPHFLEPINEN